MIFGVLENIRNHSVGNPFAIVVPKMAVLGGTFFLVTVAAMPVRDN